MTGGENSVDIRRLAVEGDRAGQRLDRALTELAPDLSRALIQKLLEKGAILLDGKTAKPAQKLKGGENIDLAVPPPEPLEARPEDLPLAVLYEDADLVVVNKAAGMVAHPSVGHGGGTLVNALLHHYGDSLSGIGGIIRPGIVHRLDKDTTGCLVAAKNDASHAGLMRQFMERGVEKIYLAVTDGVPRPVEGRVEANIGRSGANRKVHAVLKNGGRASLTFYRTLENYGAVALVECRLLTGRTHQARVHLAHVGAPVLCDRDYGRRGEYTEGDLAAGLSLFRYGEVRGGLKGNPGMGRVILARQALHAWRLAFNHPVHGQRLAFEAPLPEDMLEVLTPFRQARGEMQGMQIDKLPGITMMQNGV